jgi:hypothetical protein
MTGLPTLQGHTIDGTLCLPTIAYLIAHIATWFVPASGSFEHRYGPIATCAFSGSQPFKIGALTEMTFCISPV